MTSLKKESDRLPNFGVDGASPEILRRSDARPPPPMPGNVDPKRRQIFPPAPPGWPTYPLPAPFPAPLPPLRPTPPYPSSPEGFLVPNDGTRPHAIDAFDWLLALLNAHDKLSSKPVGEVARAQSADVPPESASAVRMLSSPVFGTGPLNPTSTARRRT